MVLGVNLFYFGRNNKKFNSGFQFTCKDKSDVYAQLPEMQVSIDGYG